MKLTHIPFNFVHIYWDKVSHFVENGLKYAEDDYTLDQAKVLLAGGQWILIAVTNEEDKVVGGLTVSFNNYPNDRIAHVTSIGGKLISSTDTYNQLSNILKSFGATKIQGSGRPSIVRLWRKLGFRERYTIVEKKL